MKTAINEQEAGDVSSYLIGAGVNRGQPAEEALVRRGRVLPRRPVARHVEGVADHQLTLVTCRLSE